jgi:hypothetical protein
MSIPEALKSAKTTKSIFTALLLAACTACADSPAQDGPGKVDALSTAPSAASRRVYLGTRSLHPEFFVHPACPSLQARIESLHLETERSPQWQALATSSAWQAYQAAVRSMDACEEEDRLILACDPEQAVLKLARVAVGQSAEMVALLELPVSKQIESLAQEGARLGCWTLNEDPVEE